MGTHLAAGCTVGTGEAGLRRKGVGAGVKGFAPPPSHGEKMEEDGTDQFRRGRRCQRAGKERRCLANRQTVNATLLLLNSRHTSGDEQQPERNLNKNNNCIPSEITICKQRSPPSLSLSSHAVLSGPGCWVLTQQKFPAGEIPLSEVNRGKEQGGGRRRV